MADLDVVIPVYNEGENIIAVLDSLSRHVRTSMRILICYDQDSDNTIPVVKKYPSGRLNILCVKNKYKGVHGAIMSGFEEAKAKAVLVMPADDDYNASIIDNMYQKFKEGCEVVSASRFMKGGCMRGCPLVKSVLVRVSSFTLYWVARIPSHDATNGFRLFSKKVLDKIFIESVQGFAFSIEILVKCHRLGWKVGEVPAAWKERGKGKSRFQTFGWLKHYLTWYFYAFATTYLRKGAATVKVRS